jgi:hypothetical protein
MLSFLIFVALLICPIITFKVPIEKLQASGYFPFEKKICRSEKKNFDWRFLENSEDTIAVAGWSKCGKAVFIGYAGYDVSIDACQQWASGLIRQSPFEKLFLKIYAVPGPKDPPYEDRYIMNSVLANQPDMSRVQIIYVAAHSSGSYVADEFIELLPDRLLSKIRLVILDGGAIIEHLKHKIKHKFVSAQKNLRSPRMIDGRSSLTLESWNFRLYEKYYGKDFITIEANGSFCRTENHIHDYVINLDAGKPGIRIYEGPRFNVEAAFPEEFAEDLESISGDEGR